MSRFGRQSCARPASIGRCASPPPCSGSEHAFFVMMLLREAGAPNCVQRRESDPATMSPWSRRSRRGLGGRRIFKRFRAAIHRDQFVGGIVISWRSLCDRANRSTHDDPSSLAGDVALFLPFPCSKARQTAAQAGTRRRHEMARFS
jgi:hypothetical protein